MKTEDREGSTGGSFRVKYEEELIQHAQSQFEKATSCSCTVFA